jgi:hypothetical protein
MEVRKMAIHPYGEEEELEFQSANAMRAELERLDYERRMSDYRRDLERQAQKRAAETSFSDVSNSIKDNTKDFKKHMEREFRSAMNENEITREGYKEYEQFKAISSIALGAAMIVAACAADAVYNKHMMDAQQDARDSFMQDVKTRTAEEFANQQMTLREYGERIEDTRRDLEARQHSYMVEYNDTHAAAQMAIGSANQTYEREMSRIDAETRKIDDVYSQAKSKFDAETAEYRKRYDEATFNRLAAPQLAELDAAKTQRDASLSMLRDQETAARTARDAVVNHQNEVIQAAQAKRDEAIQHAQERQSNDQSRFAKMQEAQLSRNAAITDSQAREIGGGLFHTTSHIINKYGTKDELELVRRVADDAKAEAKAKNHGSAYNSTVTQAEKEAAEAIKMRCNAMAVIPLVTQHGTKSDVELIKKVAEDQKAEIAALKKGSAYVPQTTDAERLAAMQLTQQYAAANAAALKTASVFGSKKVVVGAEGAAVDFVSSIQGENKRLAKELAARFSKPEDKALLDRVSADMRLANEAKKHGNKDYVPTTTKAERDRAQQIINSFAGDLKSAKGIDKTVANLNKSVADLQIDKFKLQDMLSSKKDQIGLLDGQILQMQKKIDQIAADKQALRIGKNADGSVLTAAQIKAIQDRLGKNGDFGALQKGLSELLTKRNAAKNDLAKLNGQLRDANSLIAGIDKHAKFLAKHKKVIPDVVKSTGLIQNIKSRGLIGGIKATTGDHSNRGHSKGARRMQMAGIGMIMGSVSTLHRQFTGDLHSGDQIYQTMHKQARDLGKLARGYDRVLSLTRTVGLITLIKPGQMLVKVGKLSIGKVIGKETRLAHALSAFGNSKFMKGVHGLGGFGKFVGGAVLKAPSRILSAPMALMNAPQTLAKGAMNAAFTVGRKTTGVVVGGAAYLTSKTAKGLAKVGGKALKFGYNHTIGKLPFGQKLAEKIKLRAARAKSRKEQRERKKAAKRAKKRTKKGIIGWLLGLIGGLISTIMSALLWVIGAALHLIIILIVILGIIALIYSIIEAIASWLQSTTTMHQVLVKNDPQFIINQIVNYRNAELDILELFNKANDKKVVIEVNAAPIYEALYNDSGGKRFLSWFGIDTTAPIKGTNEKGYTAINVIKNKYNRVLDSYAVTNDGKTHNYRFDTFDASDLRFEVKKYGTTALKYVDSNNVKSDYELSNAKDALALVDALYMMKTDTMQKNEVLAYLGIGDYQLTNNDGAVNNLFWETHQIIYETGTSANDVWYHVTNTTGSNNTYGLSNTYKWAIDKNSNQWTAAYLESHNVKTCDNYATITFQNETQNAYTTYAHTNLWDYTHSAYGEYKSKGAMKPTTITGYASPSKLYYCSFMCNHLNSTNPLSLFSTDSTGRKYYNIGGTNVYYKASVKVGSTSLINNYRKGGADSNRLNFFKYYGDKYHVVNGKGYYMGLINLDNYTTIQKAVTGGYQYNYDLYNKCVSLPMFYLVYDSAARDYVFHKITNASGHTSAAYSRRTYDSIDFYTDMSYWTKYACSHSTYHDAETETITVKVCKGHIDLVAKMKVTGLLDDKEGDAFFKAAQKVPGLPADVLEFGSITWKPELNVFGAGGVVWFAYHPNEDWADDDLRSLAMTKAKTESTYNIPEGKSASELAVKIQHYKSSPYRDLSNQWTPFDSIAGSPTDKKMLLGMCIDDKLLYVESYISGQQKELICYEMLKDSSGNKYLVEKGVLEIKVTSKGDVSLSFKAKTD